MSLTQQGKVARQQGGDVLSVRAVDGGQIHGQSAAAGATSQAAAIVNLTDSTTGTAGDTVDDTTASVKDDIASLAAKINGILNALRNAGIIAQ